MLKTILAGVMLAFCPQAALAVPVVLTMTTQLANISNLPPGARVNETVTATFFVDNGGTSILSQTWTTAHFLSFRVQGASGWWASSNSIASAQTSFTTNAAGQMLSVGGWQSSRANATVSSSWARTGTGNWKNASTGSGIFDKTNGVDVLFGNNLTGLDPVYWTAALAPVPVPASLPLLAAALGALALARRKSRKA